MDDGHLIRLERDLGRLEGIVGELVRGIAQDRANSEEQRKSLYSFIESSNERSEKLIEGLAEQVRRLAEADSRAMQKEASTKGQWALSRWFLVTGLTVVALVSGYLGGLRASVQQMGTATNPHQQLTPHPGHFQAVPPAAGGSTPRPTP